MSKMYGGFMLGRLISVLKVALAAVLVSLILLLVMAFVAWKLSLKESQLSLLVTLVYVIGSFVSGFGMARLMKGKRLMYGVLAGFTYFAIVLLAGIVINKGFDMGVKLLIGNFAICASAGGIGGALG